MHQPTRDRFPGLNDGWIVGRHDPPGAPPTIQNTRLANEHGDIQTQASHRRRNDYLSNRVFPETEITFDTRPHDFGESRNMSHPVCKSISRSFHLLMTGRVTGIRVPLSPSSGDSWSPP